MNKDINHINQPQHISDEMIMAYVDGEIDERDKKMLEQAVDKEPLLKEKLHMFEDTKKMLAGIYDQPLNQKIPKRFLDILEEVDKEQNYSMLSNIFFSLSHIFKTNIPKPIYVFLSVILLIIGITALYHYMTFTKMNITSPAFLLTDNFQKIMDNEPSRTILSVSNSKIQISPLLTFKDKKNRFCRKFRVVQKSTNKIIQLIGEGLACRVNNGKWQIIAYESLKEKNKIVKRNYGYEVAGANDSVDEIIKKIMQGNPIDANLEKILIKRRWKEIE